MTTVKLSAKQYRCLCDAAREVIDPFGYGATTIAALKREGFIHAFPPAPGERRTRYRATPAGLAWLATDPRSDS